MPDPTTNAQRQRDWYARQKAGIPWQPPSCQACGCNIRGAHGALCSRCWIRLTPEGKAIEAERVRQSRARKRASTNPSGSGPPQSASELPSTRSLPPSIRQRAPLDPNLPRMTLEESERRCWRCIQWDGPIGSGGSDRWGRCNLGIPEATKSQTWARGCGAYLPAKAP